MFNYEYIGNVHIHSHYSDGEFSVREIAGKAIDAGLDFICMNDHGHMINRMHFSDEGFYKKLMVMVGLEIGDKSHHYLAFDIKKLIHGNGLAPQEVINSVKEQGGFGFLAHPFEKGMPFMDKSKTYRWDDLTVQGYTGICIWNFSSRWKERVKTIFHGIFMLLFKKQTLKGPSKETLAFWDSRCQETRISAIGGSDAHGAFFKIGALRFKPLTYDFLLRSVNIHILLNHRMPSDFDKAKKEVYSAIKEGRLFIAFDKLCPSKGFRFDFMADDGYDLYMGEEGNLKDKGGEFVIELPEKGEIRLIKDGKVFRKWRGIDAFCRIKQKGVYRVEAYKRVPFFGWRPWIFSNPIYLR